jgi:hypothetical protein
MGKFELLTQKKIKIKLILNEKNGDLFGKTYGRVSRLINIESWIFSHIRKLIGEETFDVWYWKS